VVCSEAELPAGARRVVSVGGRSIGVFNVGGALYAVRNACPHQGARLCEGTVGGTMLPSDPCEYRYGLEGRVLRCPWHGWEFDLETGEKLFDPASNARVKTYRVAVEDGDVVIDA
jgi:3-phenylpropionate/trans-cinnamate dioxygenase ferredoxin subunit